MKYILKNPENFDSIPIITVSYIVLAHKINLKNLLSC